ncbi:MAG: FAD-dependent oxidoreductase [Candidatus Saccharimonadales bacterium]
MNNQLEGKDVSLWVATTDKTTYPQLGDDTTTYDAIVVGGGITGVVSAYLMQQQGLHIALVEKSNIVEWTTGGTTAKLSSQHYLTYDYLIKRHGKSVAAAYAKANQDGIDDIEQLSNDLGIDCDFERRDAYVFSQHGDKTDNIKAEVDAAKQLGLPASFETTVDIPFPVAAAIKFTDQAQFHPRKFLLGLAERFVANGGVIYEQTEVTDIQPGNPHTLITNHGNMKARSILQASGEPFWHGGIFDDHMWMKMSYGLAVTLKDNADYPSSMYITIDTPMRTIRTAPHGDGSVLIFGGESHEYDEATYDENLHYKNLIDDVKQKFDVDKILYRWLAGDYMPYDRMPYIGPHPDNESIYVVTGYRAWGLAWAMSAARAITGYVTGKPVDWVAPFSLDRLQSPVLDEDKQHRF